MGSFRHRGIDPSVMSHRLNINPSRKLVRQTMWAMEAERYQALNEEIDKFISCDFIKESFYPSWMANPPSQETKWKVEDLRGLNRFE